MRPADLDAVMAIQSQAYPPAMNESREVMSRRLAVAPSTSLVAADADGVCAYVFAYPSQLENVTALGGEFAPSGSANTLYIHDLSVLARASGQGLARRMVAHLLALARRDGLRHSALVSVQDTARFWSGLGYRKQVPSAHAAACLASYPGSAHYMSRAVD